MQILLAYSLVVPSGDRVAAGWQRVADYYGQWSGLDVHHGVDAAGIGLHMWESSTSRVDWPAWQIDEASGEAAATTYVPLRGSGEWPSPLSLMRSLAQQPRTVVSIAPPWGGALLVPRQEAVHVFNDSLGVGRLFRLDTPHGSFLSNRPAVLPLFAGIRPAASQPGWQFTMGCDWAMGATTGYRDVTAVPPGAHIMLRPAKPPTVECLSLQQRLPGLFARRSALSDPDHLDLVVSDLQDAARSVARLWPSERPTVNLSGGRDSRVVAAAFLTAGVDVRLHTHDAAPGEVDVAASLVSLVQGGVDHHIETSTSARATPVEPAVLPRAQQWHRFGESLRPSSFLWHQPPSTLCDVTGLVIGGGGGEVAHGFYYPSHSTVASWAGVSDVDVIVREATEFLDTRLCLRRGLRPKTHTQIVDHFHDVLTTAVAAGVSDVRILDYFYLDERLRRWGLIAERLGIVSPLLMPAYVQAALSMRPEERLANQLHLALLDRMIPAWAQVPFYQPTPGTQRSPRRIGAASDAASIAELLASDGPWLRQVKPQRLAELWAQSQAGHTTTSQETLLRRVVWRAGFDAHISNLRQPAPPRPNAQRGWRQRLSRR